MTLWQLGLAAMRRWYILLVGLICIAFVGLSVYHHQGVYYARVYVAFLAPPSYDHKHGVQSSLVTGSLGVVTLAGAVESRINGTTDLLKTASSGTTISGWGVRQGSAVILPDDGGQWSNSFSRQGLDVQVVGSDADDVRAKMNSLLEQVSTQLKDIQVQLGVAPVNMVTVLPQSNDFDLSYLDGRPKFALLGVAILGFGITLSVIYLLDVRVRRRGVLVAA